MSKDLPRILFVDDEPLLMQNFERNLRGIYQIDIALNGQSVIDRLAEGHKYAVILADFNMPKMDGLTLLTKVKQKCPETVRILLSGDTNYNYLLKGINEAGLFYVLEKPCSSEQVENILAEAVANFNTLNEERIALEQTISGLIRLLTEQCKLLSPKIYGRGKINQEKIRSVAKNLQLRKTWEVELASVLSTIGYLGIPFHLLAKYADNGENFRSFNEDEKAFFEESLGTASKLLQEIPKLRNVANIVRYANKCFNGKGFPQDDIKGRKIPLESRLIKILNSLQELEESGKSTLDSIEVLLNYEEIYDREILLVMKDTELFRITENTKKWKVLERFLQISEIIPGYVTKQPIETIDGIIIIPGGKILEEEDLDKLKSYQKKIGIKQPCLIEGKFLVTIENQEDQEEDTILSKEALG